MTYEWPTEIDPINDATARKLATDSAIAIPVMAYLALGISHRVAASVGGPSIEVMALNARIREVRSNGQLVGLVEL